MSFFGNLYADLKARGLLLPAILLVVAVIAAPFLLSTDPDEVVPPPPTEASSKPPETAPWVIAGFETGTRDYQERLANFEATNPFKQLFEVPEPTVDDGDNGDDGGNGGGSPDPEPVDPGPVDPVPPLLPEYFVIDVEVGDIEGTMKLKNNVQPFTVLPSSQRPVFAYIDSTSDGLQAVFSVSSESEVVGDREFCAPSPEHCVYLVLQKGQAARVRYPAPTTEDPDTPTYRLKLRAIRAVTTTTPSG